MPPIGIRPFRRSDRDQLTSLVNAHIDVVLPGVSVSPNAVLSQLEREPGEPIVDPWVTARHTLVAIQRDRVVGAVHLLRYGDGDEVGATYRGCGEIRWLVFMPVEGCEAISDALTAAALRIARDWGATAVHSDPSLPAPAVYGVPDTWPHVAAALERAGFADHGVAEAVLMARVDDIPRGVPAPLPGLTLRTALGPNGTEHTALLDGRVVGRYEVQGDLSAGGTLSRLAGWADVWNLWVDPRYRHRGVATWLVGHAADRLRLGGVQRVLDYAPVEADDYLGFLAGVGFTELTRTRRGWRVDDASWPSTS